MPELQYAYVQAAKDNGLTIDSLSLMTMNMGGANIVDDSQTAIFGGAAQFATIYGISFTDAIKKMGMCPAIGIDNLRQHLDLAGIAIRTSRELALLLTHAKFFSYGQQFSDSQ